MYSEVFFGEHEILPPLLQIIDGRLACPTLPSSRKTRGEPIISNTRLSGSVRSPKKVARPTQLVTQAGSMPTFRRCRQKWHLRALPTGRVVVPVGPFLAVFRRRMHLIAIGRRLLAIELARQFRGVGGVPLPKIRGAGRIGTGHQAVTAADAAVVVHHHHPLLVLVGGGYRAGLDAGRVLAVDAGAGDKPPPHIGILPTSSSSTTR